MNTLKPSTPRQLVVAWDFDHTLGMNEGVYDALEYVGRQIGYVIDIAGARTRPGIPIEEELAQHNIPEGLLNDARAYFRHHMLHGGGAEKATPMKGALDALACVADNGDKNVIISGKRQDILVRAVAACGLQIPEANLRGGCFKQQKTDALLAMGADVYVGDSTDDMVAAVNTGHTIPMGVTTGAYGAAELANAAVIAATEQHKLNPTFEAPPIHILSSLTAFPGRYRQLAEGYWS